jgi:hypothetical protein
MSYLIVPQQVTATSATIWIGAINTNPGRVQLAVVSHTDRQLLDVCLSPWVSDNGRNRLDYQRVIVDHLAPRQRYSLQLLIGGAVQANATVTTLPSQLPAASEKPFTVLLGSCFYGEEDQEGSVGRMYLRLQGTDERPEIKFLCGDQVYLDNPWPLTTFGLMSRAKLQHLFFEKYRKNWTQGDHDVAFGFQQLLKHGANFFVSDDHEYWNNAPDPGLVGLVNTLTPTQRIMWFEVARELFHMFQSVRPLTMFSIPLPGGSDARLSFCVADTRVNRLPNCQQFMSNADLSAIGQWINTLTGPGVLVVGQLMLYEKAGPFNIKARFDRSLPDYPQYDDLVQYLKASRHSIMVLTGDVHFGRVARCSLNPALGTELIEVISSPMQLVKGAPGVWKLARARPAFPYIETEKDYAIGNNHFSTLEFFSEGSGSVGVRVKYWPIASDGTVPRSTLVYQRTLR